jgi:hypothetical protein
MLEMNCCGKDRKGVYCSECGKVLMPGNNLYELLTHCRKQYLWLNKRIDGYKDTPEPEPDSRAFRYRQSVAKREEKWGNWVTLLEHFLEDAKP